MPNRSRRALRLARTVAGIVLTCALPSAMAQDTPEMLAAMRASMRAVLPPVPDQLPARDDLPPALRAQIPPFRIAAHRWHADPAERFVLVDGRRIGEDGVLGKELWLRQVRSDGLVLQFRDALYFQPR